MINYYVAGACGQLLVGLSAPTDPRAFSLAAGLVVAAMIPLCLTSRPAPAPPESGRLAFGELFRASRISVIGAAVSGFVLASFYQLSPLYVQHLGNGTQVVATYMACAVLGMMLFQYPVGRLADRVDRRHVIFGIALGISVAAMVVATLGARSMTLLFIGTMIFTGAAACLYPACLARLNDRTGGRQYVAANASLLLCHGIGQCIGPLVIAGGIALVGPSGLYYTVALLLLVYAAYTARRIRVYDTRVEAQQRYVAVPSGATPAIGQLDPRAPAPPPPSAPASDRLSTP
jgi:MFS family permease